MPKVNMSHADPELETTPAEEPVIDESILDGTDLALELDPDEDPEGYGSVEDMPADTILWEDGPTAGDMVKWKQQHGEVYVTTFTTDKYVTWRTLNRREYKDVVRHIEQLINSGKFTQTEANMLNEELLCEICCLFPLYKADDFSNELAGLPAIISQQILEASGFNAIEVRQV